MLLNFKNTSCCAYNLPIVTTILYVFRFEFCQVLTDRGMVFSIARWTIEVVPIHLFIRPYLYINSKATSWIQSMDYFS